MACGEDRFGDAVQTLTRPYLSDEIRYFIFGVVEDGLDEGLEGGVVRLQAVDVLFVDAFATMIGVGVVDTFRPIDRSTSSTARRISIALDLRCTSAICYGLEDCEPGCHTFDFRLRQAIQAVLTHRLFAEAASLSVMRGLDLEPVECSEGLTGLLISGRGTCWTGPSYPMTSTWEFVAAGSWLSAPRRCCNGWVLWPLAQRYSLLRRGTDPSSLARSSLPRLPAGKAVHNSSVTCQ